MTNGRLIAAFLILAGILGGLVNGSAIYSRLLYLGIILCLGAFVWAQIIRNSIFIQRSARTLRASLGDIFLEHYEIIHQGWLMAPWIEITNETQMPYSSGSRLLTMVNPHQNRSYLSRTWLTRRGRYLLGPTRVTTGDPFGLFRFSKKIQPRQSLIVLPMLFELHTFTTPAGLLPGGRVIRRKALDITSNASGLREYATGDPVKRIHWPSSLRKGQLMVKEFEQDPQGEVWLILDAQAGVHQEQAQPTEDIPVDALLFGRKPKFQLPASTLEYAISVTASLSHYFISERRAVGLLTEGRAYTLIPAERTVRQESKILETLAFLDARGSLTLAELVSTQLGQFPQGSSLILITPNISDALTVAIENLQRRNLRPMVVFIPTDAFGGKASVNEQVTTLQNRHIPVCKIGYGEDIGKALGNYSSQFIDPGNRAWQRPVLSHLI